MTAEWCEYSFTELIETKALEIGDGYRAKNSELGGDGPVFLRAGHVRDTHIDLEGVDRFQGHLATAVASKMCQPRDVIVTTKGNSTGRTSYVSKGLPPFVYSPHLSYWRSLDTEIIDPLFLRYWSQSQDFRTQLAGLSASTDMAPYLSLIDQKRLNIVLPSIHEQRAIGRMLGALDDKIELNRRMNETMEATARALFKSWFVDFDPVRVKVSGRTPQSLAPDVAALFPDALDQDQMPLGWHLGPLSDLASVVMGASPPGETYNELGVGIPLVNGPVEYGDFFLETRKWTTQPTRLSCRGDLILCVRGSTTGRHAFADDEYCLGRGVCAIRAIGSAQALVNRLVLVGLPELLSKTTGSVFPSLSSEDIKSFGVVIPPLPIGELYCELVAPLDQRIWNNVSENRSLSALRDLLLPKLIAGELRVKEAERVVGEATT
jgi:type I restriction enzyme, S subunit